MNMDRRGNARHHITSIRLLNHERLHGVGWASSTYGKVRHCTKFCSENLKGSDVFTDMRVFWKLILTLLLQTNYGVVWIGFMWLMQNFWM